MEYAKAQEIRDRIAVGVCSRIRRDRERASADMRRLLDELEAHLFDVEFDVGSAYETVDRSEEDARREFHLLTGTAPKYYLRDLRVQVAQRLLETTSLKVTMISELAGYGSLKSIGRSFRDRFGMSPSAYRRHYAAAEVHFPPDLAQKLEEGRLEEEEARVLMTYLRSHHPDIVEDTRAVRFVDRNDPSLADARSVSTQELEQLLAERLWREIEHLPREVQESKIRQEALFTFRTPALFEFLQEASVKLGREDRSRGVQIAELALLAAMEFEKPDLTTGKNTLWARAWINLGVNRRLTLKLDQAESAFRQAEYYFPAEPPPAAKAELLYSKALLCWCQRNYADGIALAEQAIELLKSADNHTEMAKALITRALLYDYSGYPQIGVESLLQVLSLLPELDDGDITTAAYYNLARSYRKLGDYGQVRSMLARLKVLSKKTNIRAYSIYIEWLDGRLALDLQDIRSAENHLLNARSGFLLIDSKIHIGLIGLDLAIVYHQQSRLDESLKAAQETMAILDLWQQNPEIDAARRRLRKVIFSRNISLCDLLAIREATDRLQEDPLNQNQFDFPVSAV